MLKKLYNLFKYQGLKAVLKSASDQLFERVEFVALQRDLALADPQLSCKIKFELRKLNDSTIKGFKNMPKPFPRHFEYRFVYEMINCYGAYVDDKICTLMWPVFRGDNEKLVTKWRYLLEDEARISNIWADPEFRGTGLMDASIERFIQFLKLYGFKYMYCFTWKNNISSIRLHKRLGFQNVGHIIRYSFKWQDEGKGIYIRGKIKRNPVAHNPQENKITLPDIIPKIKM
jgi:RimJ/RimL family protein N-acetyltransferase